MRDVDLLVGRGEILALLGPNGSGKTTLVRLLAGELRPGSGTIRVLGRDPATAGADLRRRIGVGPDDPVHLDPLSGLDNAVLFGRAAGLRRGEARRRARELLERLGLAEDLDTAVSSWSYGMRRKLLVSEALLHRPDVVLLDEPGLGLDPPSTRTVREILRERAARGATVVVATNEVVEAGRMADRVLFLHRGRRVAHGTPAALLDGLGVGLRIGVRLEGGTPPTAPVVGGMTVERTCDGVVARTRRSELLPDLLATLQRSGARIRGVDVREPHLGDVFEGLTGERLPQSRRDPSEPVGGAPGAGPSRAGRAGR